MTGKKMLFLWHFDWSQSSKGGIGHRNSNKHLNYTMCCLDKVDVKCTRTKHDTKIIRNLIMLEYDEENKCKEMFAFIIKQ